MPLLKDAGYGRKLWILMALFLLCLGIFTMVSALVMIPFVGIESLGDIGKIDDWSHPGILSGLKIAQIISALGGFAVPAYIYTTLVTEKKAEHLKLTTRPLPTTLLFSGMAMVVAIPFINLLAEWNSHLPLSGWFLEMEQNVTKMEEAFLANQSPGDFILNIIMFGLTAAVAEELFFRGAMQQLFIGWFKNVHLGIWLTAILFSALHLQFLGFLPRMVMGAMLGYVYVWSGSLWTSIFTHFLNNGLLVTIIYLQQQNRVPQGIENTGMNEGQWFYAVVSVVLSIGFLLLVWKKRNAILL